MKATIIKHAQGTDGWHQHRARSYNASDLAAAMGLSRHKTRTALMREKATGITPEVDAATQRRFDQGHEYEAIARPWAEEIVGSELFPIVLAAEINGLLLSASLDGQDLLGEVTFEHKTGSAELLASLEAGIIPREYHPQMEQGLLLSGASRCLFMASAGNRESMRYAWYESNPELRAKIIPTWEQLAQDLKGYVSEMVAPVTAAPVEALPVVSIRLDGAVAIIDNLGLFGDRLKAFVDKLPAQPSTDQEFADAEQGCKILQQAQDALEQAEAAALAQTADIERMRRTVASYVEIARTTRLTLERVVKARKEQIKVEIVTEGQAALARHIEALNQRLGKPYMPAVPADFAGAIKGKKTVTSLREAVNVTLTNAKLAANEVADRIQVNLTWLREHAANHVALFPDTAALVLKDAEAMQAIARNRVAEHEAAEAKRLEAERARIRAEEEAKVRAEAKLRAEQAAQITPAPAVAPTCTAAPSQEGAKVATPVAVRVDEPASMTLTQISARLGFTLTADFLAQLGFPATQVKASKCYRPSDFPRVCKALITHIEHVGGESLYREAA